LLKIQFGEYVDGVHICNVLVCINDFHEYIKHSTLRLFADDSILYKTIKDESDTHKLQEDLDAAAKWENDWDLV
jgi:hypothetical protein